MKMPWKACRLLSSLGGNNTGIFPTHFKRLASNALFRITSENAHLVLFLLLLCIRLFCAEFFVFGMKSFILVRLLIRK